MSKDLRFLPPMTGPPKKSTGLAASSEFSKVHLDQLDCLPPQIEKINKLYHAGKTTNQMFDTSPESQLEGQTILALHGLGLTAVADLESRWSIKWSIEWGVGTPANRMRFLVQCCCGYATERRQDREIKKKQSKMSKESGHNITNTESWSRHVPYDFTGCLAHAEVTFQKLDNAILRIRGYLNHNDACTTSHMQRIPPIPLHPHVYDIALKQLQDGADLMSIQATNRKYIDSKFYNGMDDPLQSKNLRYLILQSDTSYLYRRFAKLQGINTYQRPEVNVDNWLNSRSPQFKPELYNAVLHYAARTSKDERFEVTIATTEMREATWRYGHKSQIILDGTFGVCDSRLLLFIVMGIDEERHGIPLVFFLFSAPSGNRLSSSGYNTAILIKVLKGWKDWLEKDANKSFTPLVVITDTDTKERGALSHVFPSIILLLCKFHLRQCWTNRRKSLKLNQAAESGSFEGERVLSRLFTLELRLIESSVFEHAQAMLAAEVAHMLALESSPPDASLARAAGTFLAYLREQWMVESLWRSWSRAGRLKAAAALQTPVDGVLPTTNHLESFNRILKHGHIGPLQKGGKRLRFDVLFLYLITRIIPAIFSSRRHSLEYRQWVSSRFTLSMAANTAQAGTRARQQPSTHPTAKGYAAWLPVPLLSASSSRTIEAQEIAKRNLLINIHYPNNTTSTLKANCLSSKTLPLDLVPISYDVQVQTNGFATCSCPDFMYRSIDVGACKHICALIILTEHARNMKDNPGAVFIPQFWLPTDVTTAIKLRNDNLQVGSSIYHAGAGHHAISPPESGPQVDQMVDTMVNSSDSGDDGPASSSGILFDSEVVGHVTNVLMDMLHLPDTGLVQESKDVVKDDSGISESGLSYTNSSLAEVELANSNDNEDLAFVQTQSVPIRPEAISDSDQLESNHSAIQAQLHIHLNHFTRKLIPQLLKIETLLDETELTRTADLVELGQILLRIQELISSKLPSTDNLKSTATVLAPTPQDPAPPETPPQPSTTQLLYPPSPESRQKRIQSRSIF